MSDFTKHSKADDIDKEVSSLLKKNINKPRSNYAMLDELKRKYKDEELVDAILDKYRAKMAYVKKVALKIKERLIAKYPNLTMKEYIDKIKGYQEKYKLGDSEIKAVIDLIFQHSGQLARPDNYDLSYNAMSKALGFVPASYNFGGELNVPKDEINFLQGILSIAAQTRELHNQVSLQHLIYEDCADVAFQVNFDRQKVNVFSFIHPVIAALFFPKFNVLDQHMILGSIAGIVQCKYEGHELRTQPDYELYMDIATDPSETTCVNKIKPFEDLLSRCNIQTKLWESVLNLRQGKYYTNDLNSFIQAIDQCRASIFDAADLVYVKDEGTILRKLFAAFSFRPTIVMTMPIHTMMPTITSNITAVTASQVTTLSMVTIRMPISNINNENASTVNLSDALQQQQLYLHHRQITVKSQDILYSRELLAFYIHRRYQTFNLARLANPYNLSFLPNTISAHEKLQRNSVNVPVDNLNVGSQVFNLKSVVCVEVLESNDSRKNQTIYSCSTIVRNNNNNNWIVYNPLDLGSTEAVPSGEVNTSKLFPIKTADYGRVSNDIATRGTIFIYRSRDSGSDTLATFYH